MYSNLDISIKKALEQRVDSNCELLVTCFAHTSLHNVIELFVSHEAHRLIIIDGSDKVIGIICLSDVLAFLITEHNELSELTEDDLVRQSDRADDRGRERGLERSVSNKVNVSDKVLERINELSEQKRLDEEKRPKDDVGKPSGDLDSRKVSDRSTGPEGSKVSDKVKQIERRLSGEPKKESNLSREQSKESSQKSSRGSRELSEEQSSESDLSKEPDESTEGSTQSTEGSKEESREEASKEPRKKPHEDKNGEEFTVWPAPDQNLYLLVEDLSSSF